MGGASVKNEGEFERYALEESGHTRLVSTVLLDENSRRETRAIL